MIKYVLQNVNKEKNKKKIHKTIGRRLSIRLTYEGQCDMLASLKKY